MNCIALGTWHKGTGSVVTCQTNSICTAVCGCVPTTQAIVCSAVCLLYWATYVVRRPLLLKSSCSFIVVGRLCREVDELASPSGAAVDSVMFPPTAHLPVWPSLSPALRRFHSRCCLPSSPRGNAPEFSLVFSEPHCKTQQWDCSVLQNSKTAKMQQGFRKSSHIRMFATGDTNP